MNGPTVGLVLGLAMLLVGLAALVAVLTECVSRFLGLRGEYLMRGIRSLIESPNEHTFQLTLKDILRRTPGRPPKPEKVITLGNKVPDASPETDDVPLVSQLLATSFVASSAHNGDMPENAGNASLPNRQRRRIPSYLSGRAFSDAVRLYLLRLEPSGRIPMDSIKAPGPLNDLLQVAKGKDYKFIDEGLARWYDEHMDRVSGWYKRHVLWISVAMATILVLVLNVNAFALARGVLVTQSTESAVLSAVSSLCEGLDAVECSVRLNELGELPGAAPSEPLIGWGDVRECSVSSTCSFLDELGLTDPDATGISDPYYFAKILAGWVTMIVLLTCGARLLFDLTSKLGSLRSSGPKPERTDTRTRGAS